MAYVIPENDWMLELDTHIAAALEVALPPKDERTNVNSQPFYIGKWMVLSDQDLTALKHHILSSAVMGTVFAGILAWVAQPTVPFFVKALVLGGLLTGAQAALVAISNVGILAFEQYWPRRGELLRFIGRAYLEAHTVHLSNGATVWIDSFMGTVVLDDGNADWDVGGQYWHDESASMDDFVGSFGSAIVDASLGYKAEEAIS